MPNTTLRNNIIIKSVLIILLFSSRLLGQTDFFASENRKDFGNYLFNEKDYLRAISEYKSYLQNINNDTIKFKMAIALSEMGRRQEAEDNFKGLFFGSSLSDESKLEFIKSNFFTEDSKTFRNLINNSPFIPEKYERNIKQLKQLSLLMEENALVDTFEIANLFSENEKIELMKFHLRKIYPQYKSPGKAALLSALIPGLGKVYTGEVGDGITSFLFTGILSFLAYDNFNANHNFRAWLFTGLAAWFYGGNIYGSAAAAQIYNAGIKFNFNNELKIYLDSKDYFIPEHNFLNK